MDFFNAQLQFLRVANAYATKGEAIENLLRLNEIHTEDFDLFLRAFKDEKKLELWVKNKEQSAYVLIRVYDFCQSSGVLGPKRISGDLQIPEGFYEITNFNPQSAFHLSFKINYPNESDLFFADKQNPGNDIYIHGNSVTVGCIPLGDNNMEELYLLAAKAKSAGGVVYVHIFPCQMSNKKYRQLQINYKNNAGLIAFWASLKPMYDAFEQSRKLPRMYIDNEGRYQIKEIDV